MNEQQEDNLQSTDDAENNEGITKPGAEEDTSALYFGDTKLQSQSEFTKNKKSDHTKEDNSMTAGGVDDTESNSDGAAGTDRAGTFERKKYGDTELNKGLEAQAKDEESL